MNYARENEADSDEVLHFKYNMLIEMYTKVTLRALLYLLKINIRLCVCVYDSNKKNVKTKKKNVGKGFNKLVLELFKKK